MMRKKWLLIIFAGTVIFSGCASRRQMAETEMQVKELRREHQQIMAAINHLDSLIVEQSQSSKKLTADLKMSMSALEERMLLVESSLEDAGNLVNRAVEVIENRRPVRAPKDSADTSRAVSGVNHMKVYKLAYQDVTKGNYKMAIEGFEEYLKAYSKTSLADNAVYWIGECFYIQKDYANSQRLYAKLIEEYPKSEHLGSSKLKLGMSLYNQRYKTKAKQYFEDVVKEYPGTDQANQAAEMLERYKR